MTTAANFDITANDRTAAAFKSVEKSLKELGGTAIKAGAVAGTAIAGTGIAITGLTLIAAKNAKEMTSYSRAIGIGVEELSAWGYASETVSVSQEKLNDILKDTTEKIGDAYLNNGGEAVEILKRLNLSAKDMAALSPDQQLLKIAEGLESVGTQSEKVVILESLASDASLLLPLLDNNAGKLKELTKEAHEMGISLNSVDAAKIEAANKAWDKTLSILNGIGQKIASMLSPYVVEVGDNFGDAAKQSKGFVDIIESGMRTSVLSVAYLADVIQGLSVVWGGVNLIFQGFAAGMFNTLDSLQHHILGVINLVPGVDVKPIETLSAMTKEANKEFNNSKVALQELISQPMPSEAVTKFFNDVDKRATAAAEKIAAVVNPKKKSGGDIGDAKFDKGADLERLLGSYESEYVLLEQKHTKEQLLIDEAYLNGELSEEKHQQTMADIGERYAKSKESLDAVQSKQKLAVAKGIFGNLSTLMSSESKKEFEVGKKFAIANALIKGYEAVTSSYAAGAKIGGPWLGAAYAGTAVIATNQQIKNIQSQSFGAGGGVSVSGGAGGGVSTGSNLNGGAPSGPSSEASSSDNSSGGTTVFQFVGKDRTFTGDEVVDMFSKFKELIGSGEEVLIEIDSRQALELKV